MRAKLNMREKEPSLAHTIFNWFARHQCLKAIITTALSPSLPAYPPAPHLTTTKTNQNLTLGPSVMARASHTILRSLLAALRSAKNEKLSLI